MNLDGHLDQELKHLWVQPEIIDKLVIDARKVPYDSQSYHIYQNYLAGE